MVPKLYIFPASCPVRSVLITAAAIGLDLDKENVDLLKGDQLKPEFTKLNPLHTVPVLVDGDFVLWDSHAIATYLVSKYAKDDSFYPKDLQKRGIVDNRLHLNNATLFAILKQIGQALFLEQQDSFPSELFEKIENAYDLLNTLLEKSKFMAGDKVTVADFCIITSITSLNVYVSMDEAKWPHLAAWVERVKELPYYAVNEPGQKCYEQMAMERWKK